MPIYELQLTNLGPFDEIEFEFDPQINVFVGPNNCGKSTVLMALAGIRVCRFSIPNKLFRRKIAQFQVCVGRTCAAKRTYPGKFPVFEVDFPRDSPVRYEKSLHEQGFNCLIPALRWSTDFRAKVPVAGAKEKNGETISSSAGSMHREALTRSQASIVADEAIIQKIIELDYRAYRERNPAIRKILDKIATVASEITDGFPIAFVGVAEDKDGLYPEFKTPDGNVPLNVLSQGTQSIIQWLGLLLIGYAEYYGFPKDLEDAPGVVIIDEIDAHMHPSWQRRILPTLSRNFPKLQIFCSSHSPFVLAGLKTGQAQLLKRDRKGKVVVSRNPTDLIGWSMDEILRNFLDITNPTDLQTSENIERLQELRSKKRLTRKQKEELEHLRETLNQDLLAGPVSSDIERLAERMRNPAAQPPSRRKTTPAKKKTKKVSAVRTRRTGAKRAGRQR